ncbi:MAG: alpha/beta hydrolase, partial [Microcella sp.]|nr:alpha/beta hydrolase [Microcella sp.]
MSEPSDGVHVDESGPADADSILFLHGGNVASPMWQLQREGLPEFHQLVPDMPGFGKSVDLGWTGLDDTVERLAGLIRTRAHGGTAHVVAISLGASVGLMLTARHPDLVRSALLSGTPIRGLGPVMRTTARVQLWLWKAVAAVTSIGRTGHEPPEAVTRLIEKGLGLEPSGATAVVNLVNGGLGRRVHEITGSPVPILGVAGSRESRVVTRALADFARADRAILRVAPGSHHLWIYQAPGLFTDAIRTWVAEQRAVEQL